MTKRKIKNIQISADWLDLLALKFPDLLENGVAWAFESLIADLLQLPRPRTPQEARKAGAATRGKQLKGKPALRLSTRK